MVSEPGYRLIGRLLDHCYAIDVDDADLAAHLEIVLADSRAVADGPEPIGLRRIRDGGYRLVVPDEAEVVTPSASWALSALFWHLNRRVVAGSAARLLIHGAAVGSEDDGVLVVGGSGSGKSTAALVLGVRGRPYVTDDVVAIEPGGTVWGSAKPIGVRAGSLAIAGIDRQRLLEPPQPYRSVDRSAATVASASSLGLTVGAATRPRLIVFPTTERPPGDVAELRRSDALARLVRLAFNVREHHPAALERLAELVRGRRCIEWGRGPAATLLAAVHEPAADGGR